jgi:tRNA A37 methylthiotransferase MiaB
VDIHCTFCAIKKIRNQVSTSVETVLMFVTKKNKGKNYICMTLLSTMLA